MGRKKKQDIVLEDVPTAKLAATSTKTGGCGGKKSQPAAELDQYVAWLRSTSLDTMTARVSNTCVALRDFARNARGEFEGIHDVGFLLYVSDDLELT